jgi:hypothetical protein
VPDCADRFTSTMTRRRTGNVCPTCDRSYEGPYAPFSKGDEDTCTELLDQTPPTEGAFGLLFTSATQWTVWTEDGNTGEWSEVGVATDDGTGHYIFTSGDTLNEAIAFGVVTCDAQDIGFLTATLSFAAAAR